MLCMQQCIELCDISPEETDGIRAHAALSEILAIQAECPYTKAAAKGEAADPDVVATCGMLDLRDRLPEEAWAAEDYDDLEGVIDHYSDYAEAIDADGVEAG